jgi:hypothetical protein
MPDSLLVAGLVELLGGGQILQYGPGQGAKIMLYTGSNFGSPVIDNDAVQSLLLDGERPYGERASNRTIKLPILIHAPGRIKLLQAREQLLQLVDQEAWELTYQPDGFNPMVWTCFRATITPQTTPRQERQDYALLDLEFSAFPYGRSTDLQTIPIVQASGSQVAPIIIDAFDDANVGAGWFTDNVNKIQGSRSIYNLSAKPIAASRNFAAKDLSQMTSLRVWTTMGPKGNSRGFWLVLFDSQGHVYNAGLAEKTLRGNYAWDRIDWRLTPTADFDLTQVTGYRLSVSGPVYLDQLTAVPKWQQTQVTSRGAVVTVPGVQGTARAPINLQLSWASTNARQQFIVHRAPKYAPVLYSPLVPYDSSAVLNGSTQVTCPAVDGVSAGPRWNGTHIVYVGFTSFSGAGNRTITVSFRQYWNDAGIGGGTDHASATVTAVVDQTASLALIGSIDLPLVNMATDNSATSWTIGVTSSVTADRVGEILVLDTRGETMFMSSARTATSYWIDEPDTMRDPYDYVGKVVGGSSRSQALSVSGETAMPWRPFSLEPGDNTLMLYCPQEAPDATISLYPRWRTVRLV